MLGYVNQIKIANNEPSLDIRKNELGLRFLYKLRSNPTYMESLITLDDSEDYNYEDNERAT